MPVELVKEAWKAQGITKVRLFFAFKVHHLAYM